jgi:hypothetical protein
MVNRRRRIFKSRGVAPWLSALAVVVTIAVLESSAEGYTSKQEADQLIAAGSNAAVIRNAIVRFAMMEGRDATSLEELCASPWIAVRCPDLINPYTGKPVADKQDSPGDVHFEMGSQGKAFRTGFLPLGSGRPLGSDRSTMRWDYVTSPGWTFHEYAIRDGRLQTSSFFHEGDVRERTRSQAAVAIGGRFPLKDLWQGRSDPDLAAFAVGSYIHRVMLSYVHKAERLPASIAEVESWNKGVDLTKDWKEFNRVVWFVPKVRNDWSGGHAVEGKAPGNYEYQPGSEFPCYSLRVYGGDGKVIHRVNDYCKDSSIRQPFEFGNPLIEKQ